MAAHPRLARSGAVTEVAIHSFIQPIEYLPRVSSVVWCSGFQGEQSRRGPCSPAVCFLFITKLHLCPLPDMISLRDFWLLQHFCIRAGPRMGQGHGRL